MELDGVKMFNRILLQEPIRFGQRVSSFEVFTRSKQGEWIKVFNGTTIGYKRLIRLESSLSSNGIKIKIKDAGNQVAISNIGVFLDNESPVYSLR